MNKSNLIRHLLNEKKETYTTEELVRILQDHLDALLYLGRRSIALGRPRPSLRRVRAPTPSPPQFHHNSWPPKLIVFD